jgi:hypothetical protein
MSHKFHYDTPKQALCWLRVHEAFSPARHGLIVHKQSLNTAGDEGVFLLQRP